MTQQVPLGELAEFINGVAFKPADWEDEGKRIIRIQNLTDCSKPFNRTSRSVADKYHVMPGDLLVSWSATLGVFEWCGPDTAIVNQHIFRVIPDEQRVFRQYLKHMLADALLEMERHLHGATMQHVNRREFLATEIPLPPLAEQKRIAKILDAVDALRTRRRESLAQLDALLQSAFLEMFGDPVENPKGWDTELLGEWLEAIDSGWSPKCLDRQAERHEWGVLKLGAVTWCRFDESEQKALPDTEDPRPAIEVRAGDLLFARKNTHELVAAAAYVYHVRPSLMLPDLIFRIKLREDCNVDAEFLWRLLIEPHQRKQIQSLAGGVAGSMPNISKAKLRSVHLIKPPFDQQKAFTKVLTRARSQIDLLNVELTTLDSLFASLQQTAFRGRL